MSTPTTDALVRTFIKIRDARSENKRTFEAVDEQLKQKLRRVENELLRRAQEQGVKGFTAESGTTYIKEDKHVSIADSDDYMEFVLETGDLLFYEQRPSLKHIVEYQNAHDGKLPPGVRMFRENRMRVRAAKQKGEVDDD